MRAIREKLAGSDLRSIGRANEVARAMAGSKLMVAEAVRLLSADDPVLRARAADALEKATRAEPALLRSHKKALLRRAGTALQHEVRWHVAQMLPRLSLRPTERKRAMEILRGYSVDASRIVQVCAMQALWELSSQSGRQEAWVVSFVERRALEGSPAVRARARRLLKRRDGALLPPRGRSR